MTSLAEKWCVPCEAETPPFTLKDAEKYLGELPDWTLVEGEKLKIQRKFRFPTYLEGIRFVNKVAELAEEEGHHPDMLVGWRRITVEFMTHAIRGLSENDFIMAAKINQLAAAPNWRGKQGEPRDKRN